MQYPIPGNLVQIDYTCRLQDGSLVETTLAQIAGNDNLAKSTIFELHSSYPPFFHTVPDKTDKADKTRVLPFAALESKINSAISEHISELPLERTTLLTLPSTAIENMPNKDRFLQMAMHFTMPRLKEMSRQDFTGEYDAIEPKVGISVDVDSDTPGVIRTVEEDKISVYYSLRAPVTVPFAWGAAKMEEADADNFKFTMDVRPGQLIPRIGGLPGRVVKMDQDQFTIDFGQSFAGETLFCDVVVNPIEKDLTKASQTVQWIENLELGLQSARRQGKPVLLFLYSDDSPECAKMLRTILPDPSFLKQREDFIWVKADMAKMPELGRKYGWDNKPLTLILNGIGQELERYSGIQYIPNLAYKLDQFLAKTNKG